MACVFYMRWCDSEDMFFISVVVLMHYFFMYQVGWCLSMNDATCCEDIGLVYSWFIMVMICGICFLSVLNGSMLDLFQCLYNF